MNIKDFKEVELPVGLCRLEAIFSQQHHLMDKYKDIEARNLGSSYPLCPVDMNSCQGQQKLKDYAWRITEEIGESMSSLKNKPWKSTHVATDVDHYREELADAFHFFVELCILSGIEADDLFKLYFRKAEVNAFRQRTNY